MQKIDMELNLFWPVYLLQAIKMVNSTSRFEVMGFQYEIIRGYRYEDMLDFYRDHFFPDEPLAQSLGCVMGDELRGIMRSALQHNISIALVSCATKEIIGGRIIHIADRNDVHDASRLKAEPLRKVIDIMTELDRRCNIFDHYCVNDVIHFFGIGVRRDYRRRGIGEMLMRAAICFVRNLGLGDVIIKGEGTSTFSQRVFEKIGFDILSEIVYADYKVDRKAVTTGRGDHKCEKLYGMRINSVQWCHIPIFDEHV